MGIAGVIVVVGAAAIGYAVAISSRGPDATPTPSAASSPGLACEVSVSPETIVVDPDTGESGDVLFVAGAGFPPNRAATIYLEGSTLDVTTTGSGGFTTEIQPAPGVTYPAPPNIEAGTVTWNVTGWDAPTGPGSTGSLPPRACETQLTVTIELTHTPSATPALDLSAGSYAEVVADGVRVRVEPSLEATAVGALYTGDVVRILAPALVAEGLAWYRIETVVVAHGQALHGYMAAGGPDGQAYLRPTIEPPPPTPSPSPSPSPSPAP